MLCILNFFFSSLSVDSVEIMPNARRDRYYLLVHLIHTHCTSWISKFEILEIELLAVVYFLWKVCLMSSILTIDLILFVLLPYLIDVFFFDQWLSVANQMPNMTKRQTSDSDQIRNTPKQIYNNLWLNTHTQTRILFSGCERKKNYKQNRKLNLS